MAKYENSRDNVSVQNLIGQFFYESFVIIFLSK